MKTVQGFKQTEIGEIPEDWDVVKLGDKGSFGKGKGIKKDETIEEGHPCIRYGEIYTHYDNYIRNFISFISSKVAKSSQKIKKGDLLFAGSGETAEEIGKCIAFLGDETAYAGGDIILFKPTEGDSQFLGYLMNHKLIIKQKARMAQGDAVVHIYSNHLKSIILPFPNLNEQKAIAQVLSDLDSLLESLEKLIVKKKNIKEGAMQQLLTGKKRLSGFKGEWQVKKLGEVTEITKGQGLSKGKLSPSGEYPCILYGELFTTYKEEIKKVYSKSNFNEGKLSKYGDILIPGSTTTVGIDLAKASALLINDVRLGGDINILRNFNNTYDSTFLAYCLTHIYKNQIAQKAKGITIYHLQGKDLKDLVIKMPEAKEQSVIAQILSDMSAEIEELDQKRDKVKFIKDGMMQQLLTGRIRLIWVKDLEKML